MKHFAPVVVPRKSQPADGSSASVVATFDFETLVAETPGQCYLEFVDCYVISIRDVELIKDDAAVTDDDITAMEQVQGKYWKVGEVDSLPVFRQEADDGGSKEFFLCRLADGWFITSSLVSPSDDTKKAWLGQKLTAEFDAVHMPFWSKKKASTSS